MLSTTKQFTWLFTLLLPFQVMATEPESIKWPIIKDELFGKQTKLVEDTLIKLTTPYRAADAALVPINIDIQDLQSEKHFVEKIFLVVDNNPVPVVGTFELSPLNGDADISTRVRINANSHVRAIAQTSDGVYHITSNYVKASGGCSAPAGADDELARKRMGKMKLKHKDENDLTRLQLMISHPNYSGLQIDQLTRNWIPADYVNEVQVKLDGTPLLSFSGGISISENPTFSFYLKKGEKGRLTADVKDSQGREFSGDWQL